MSGLDVRWSVRYASPRTLKLEGFPQQTCDGLIFRADYISIYLLGAEACMAKPALDQVDRHATLQCRYGKAVPKTLWHGLLPDQLGYSHRFLDATPGWLGKSGALRLREQARRSIGGDLPDAPLESYKAPRSTSQFGSGRIACFRSRDGRQCDDPGERDDRSSQPAAR